MTKYDAAAALPTALWVVIDTNRLASDELRLFLAASPENRAILPDYVAMERFKPDNLEALRNGFSVLKDFADQVVILKGTGEVSALNPDEQSIALAMIDAEQTEAFPQFCRLVDRALDGDAGLICQLRERAQWAQSQMAVVLSGASGFTTGLAEFEAFFAIADLAHLRRGGILTPAMHEKFDAAVAALAQSLLENAPIPITPPRAENWREHFILRSALCHAVYMLSMGRRGISARQPQKARNDTVDVLLATYGTYFNGVMSEDSLTNEVHHVARYILEADGAPVGPDYLELAAQVG